MHTLSRITTISKLSLSIPILILALIGLTMISSCGKEDIVETDAELQPYFQIFANEAAKRGFNVDYEAERIEGLLQNIRIADVLGQCFRNDEKPRKVIIDIDIWNDSDEAKKQFLIFHELGHCFLDRGHRDDKIGDECVSIMHSNTQLCPDFRLNDDNREGYLDELFDI